MMHPVDQLVPVPALHLASSLTNRHIALPGMAQLRPHLVPEAAVGWCRRPATRNRVRTHHLALVQIEHIIALLLQWFQDEQPSIRHRMDPATPAQLPVSPM